MLALRIRRPGSFPIGPNRRRFEEKRRYYPGDELLKRDESYPKTFGVKKGAPQGSHCRVASYRNFWTQRGCSPARTLQIKHRERHRRAMGTRWSWPCLKLKTGPGDPLSGHDEWPDGALALSSRQYGF